jgi:hypothetical protein
MDARILQFFKDNFGKPYSEIAPKLKNLFNDIYGPITPDMLNEIRKGVY